MRDELIFDFVHAHTRLERVLATFQGAAIAVEHRENVEPHPAVDNARALELIRYAAAVILASDDHHLVLGKRPRIPCFLHEPSHRADGRERSRRTKVSNPLRLDRPIRRGLRGGWEGGGAGSFSAGLVATAEQAHARPRGVSVAGIVISAHVFCRFFAFRR